METIQAAYQITVGDFRKASYFGLFLRHRRPLRILFVVLAVGILYGLGAYYGLGRVNPLVLFITVAYLGWGLLLFAGTERNILRYLRSPETLIGCRYEVTIESHRIRTQIPQRKVNVSYQLNQLTCVFELSHLFLIYTTPQETYLLPKRSLTEEQIAALRQTFRDRLGDNFGSRFDKKKK